MEKEFALFPQQASTIAPQVDALYLFLVGVTFLFTAAIAAAILYFIVRYRRRAPEQRGARVEGSIGLEIAWIAIPFLIAMAMFVWGSALYVRMHRPPENAIEIRAIGKQWMWKFQHTGGQREINTLTVPLGRPVKLLLTSQDVIHSFFVPAFRVKMDVVPGRTTMVWFEATKAGRYHLFCAEYCGTQHSGMIGQVVVLEPVQYQAWLAGGPSESLAQLGQKLFRNLGCDTCHLADRQGLGPMLVGLFGTPVRLQTGQTVVADEDYIRESILNPAAKVVAGFQPIMPTFRGRLSEEQLIQLVAYIRSLGEGPPGVPPAALPREAARRSGGP
jgi:cytochrome c oxidase subunit 2